MAYADQRAGNGRIVALIIVALLHVAIGYAFISGLAYKYVKKAVDDTETFDVVEPPPPPEEVPPPPPPPEAQPQTPPPVVTPPPIVRTQSPPPVVIQSVTTPPPTYNPVPIAAPPAPPVPPAPVAPPAPAISKAAGPRGNLGQYFGRDNYPPSAVRDGAEGRVRATLTIGTDGRVSNCVIASSSGNSALDDATCRGARRARFTPAQNAAGQPVSSSYPLSIRWTLEE